MAQKLVESHPSIKRVELIVAREPMVPTRMQMRNNRFPIVGGKPVSLSILLISSISSCLLGMRDKLKVNK